MNGNCPSSDQMVGFGISSVKSSSSDTTLLVNVVSYACMAYIHIPL